MADIYVRSCNHHEYFCICNHVFELSMKNNYEVEKSVLAAAPCGSTKPSDLTFNKLKVSFLDRASDRSQGFLEGFPFLEGEAPPPLSHNASRVRCTS